MMRFRKGQAAMEFLMTYGWAILIVLAAIGALAYFGVLSPGRFLPSSFTMSGGFSAGQYKISTSALNFTVINSMGVDVTVNSINVTSKAGSDVTCSVEVTPNQLVGNGGSYDVNTAGCTGSQVGQKFKADIKVVYTRSGETVTHTATGEMTTAVEE